MFVLTFTSGLIILNLGVIGYYIGRVFDETKQRPLYLVETDTLPRLSSKPSLQDVDLGPVVWITGLSGAGKSSVAQALRNTLLESGIQSILLDGDELRNCLGVENAVSRDERVQLGLMYGRLAKLLASQGQVVIVATISMFNEVFRWNRENIPGYIDVFLDTPLDELRKRDPKGIYRKFDEGQLETIAGLDLDVDYPRDASLIVKFRVDQSPSDTAEMIRQRLKEIYEN